MHFDKDKLYVFRVSVTGNSATIDLPEIYSISDGATVRGYRVEKLVDELSGVTKVCFSCDGYYLFSQTEDVYKLIQELRKCGVKEFTLDIASPLDGIIEAAQDDTLGVILLACFDTVTTEFGTHTYTRKQVHARSAELGHDYEFFSAV